MTGKERMLTALGGGVPDRLPITIQLWHPYHLSTYMGGMDQLEAYMATGLDAMVGLWYVLQSVESPDWIPRSEQSENSSGGQIERVHIETPGGELTHVSVSKDETTYTSEYLIKNERDAKIFLKYHPEKRIDKEQVSAWYDRTGDHGIVRGFVPLFAQPGPWPELCALAGMERAIFWAMDEPEFVHHFLSEMTRWKVETIHRELHGAKFDLIEGGGGAASANVISPSMFDEFCVPYARQINQALHEEGFYATYHTCGAIMAILDHIPKNGCDTSETLNPPGLGGDIATVEQRRMVKKKLGSNVSLIGGIDQSKLEAPHSPEVEAAIAADVRGCFDTFGREGGYICSTAGQFFHAPPENLKALARAGAECCYA